MTRTKKQKRRPKPAVSEFDHRDTAGPQDWRAKFAVQPVGRPTDYDPKFHPKSYVELSNLGRTRAQVAATWGICRDTLQEWSKDKKNKPEFSAAIKKGDELRVSWWENFGQAGAAGAMKNFKQTAWIFFMKNICQRDYKDRIEVTNGLDVEDIEW